MAITPNLINIAKGLEHSSFIRTKLQKGARTSVFNQVKQSLERIKLNRLQAQDGFALVNDNAREAAEALANMHPPVAPDVFEAATQRNKLLQDALHNFESTATTTDAGLTALSRLKIKKNLSFKVTGNEYARIKSLPVLGEKHPVVKVNLPVRGTQAVGEYVDNAHTAATDYIQALQTRTPFVSPRLARHGKDITASVGKYNEAVGLLTQNVEDETFTAAELLASHSVPVKVLQNGKFRIQIKNQSQVGPLSAKIKLGKQSMTEHIQEGLTKAARVVDALREDAASPLMSNRMLRNNFVQKQIDFKALAHFEAAKAALNIESARIEALKAQGLLVKVLRDGAFRITRLNSEGIAAKTRTIPFTKHVDMANHIENGLVQAERLATQELPEKIATKQKLKNAFHPFKKKVLNFLG